MRLVGLRAAAGECVEHHDARPGVQADGRPGLVADQQAELVQQPPLSTLRAPNDLRLVARVVDARTPAASSRRRPGSGASAPRRSTAATACGACPADGSCDADSSRPRSGCGTIALIEPGRPCGEHDRLQVLLPRSSVKRNEVCLPSAPDRRARLRKCAAVRAAGSPRTDRAR